MVEAPAVDGKHVDNEKGVQRFTLSEKGLNFTINNVVLNAADDGDFKIRTEGDYLFQVTTSPDATQPSFFKGALIRVRQNFDDNDEVFEFDPVGDNAQDTLACVGRNVIGVTHRGSDPKTSLAGLFTTNSTRDVVIGVTVVESNDDEQGSIYSYSQFRIGVVPPTVSSSTISCSSHGRRHYLARSHDTQDVSTNTYCFSHHHTLSNV